MNIRDLFFIEGILLSGFGMIWSFYDVVMSALLSILAICCGAFMVIVKEKEVSNGN